MLVVTEGSQSMLSTHAALEVPLRGRSSVQDHVLRAMQSGQAEPSLTIYSTVRNWGQVLINCNLLCTQLSMHPTNKGTWTSEVSFRI